MPLEVQHLSKQYGQQRAVDNISFRVETGEVVGFLGPNGAGKSTTMKIATGFLAPTAGTVLVSGMDVKRESLRVRKTIGYLAEHNPLYLDMYVHEYLRFCGGIFGMHGRTLAGRVGANIAAEIGTMRVTEQVDALETLSFDPIAYLVVPRVLAGTLMFPVVVGVAMFVGLGAGWAASLGLLDLSTPEFLKGVRLFFDTFDVRYGLVKSASFGFAVTILASTCGLATRGGAQGVGGAATKAVVQSAVMILVLDAFWAMVWLLGRAR